MNIIFKVKKDKEGKYFLEKTFSFFDKISFTIAVVLQSSTVAHVLKSELNIDYDAPIMMDEPMHDFTRIVMRNSLSKKKISIFKDFGYFSSVFASSAHSCLYGLIIKQGVIMIKRISILNN